MAEEAIGECTIVDGRPAIVLSGDYAGRMIENNPELRNNLVKEFRKIFDNELERAKRRVCT